MITSSHHMTKSITPKSIVVYADDDLDDIELVQEAFRQYARDVEVITFGDGYGALSYFERLTTLDPLPCLVILDINMPGLNGKEVLVQLRKMEKVNNVPVVLFTTSNQPADKNFAQQFGAGMITKPLNIKQMERITEQFIDHCTEEIQKKIRNHQR
jgi:CheY-like chemotaxis protein